MRSRPDIDLRLPPAAHPGDDLVIDVTATSHSSTPIEFFEIAFEGDEVVGLNVNPSQQRVTPILRSTVRLREAGVLEQGEHKLTARFKVPLDAPASYFGPMACVRYQVRVHVSIPWWPDLRETYELLVERHPAVRPAPQPATASSASGAGEPFLEISIADTRYAPGDEVSGAFAAGNVPRGAGESIELAVIAMEQALGRRFKQRVEQHRHNVPTVFAVPRGGREVPFRFRIPETAVPSFESANIQLAWMLQAELRLSVGRAKLCEIPLVIGRYAGKHSTSNRHAEVGAGRWRAVWSEAGEPYGLKLREDGIGLVGARGDVRIEVQVREGEDQVELTAAFTYPSLRLGLRAEPHLVVMLPSQLELQFPGHKIACREEAQAAAFLTGPLRHALQEVKIVSIDDARASVRAPATDFDRPSVDRFLVKVAHIAGALTTAIEAIPPPAAMHDALPAWRAFAIATGAAFSPGGMTLADASFDGAMFELATMFDRAGAVTCTRVTLKVDPPIQMRATLDADAGASFSWAPPGCYEIAKALGDKVQRLDIHAETLSIEVAGPTADPADLRPRMIEMLVLARRLRGDRSPGPYR